MTLRSRLLVVACVVVLATCYEVQTCDSRPGSAGCEATAVEGIALLQTGHRNIQAIRSSSTFGLLSEADEEDGEILFEAVEQGDPQEEEDEGDDGELDLAEVATAETDQEDAVRRRRRTDRRRRRRRTDRRRRRRRTDRRRRRRRSSTKVDPAPVVVQKPTQLKYKEFKFTYTTRNANQGEVQLAELTLYHNSVDQGPKPLPATPEPYNDGGKSPGGEPIERLVDGDKNSKWLDFNKKPVRLVFSQPISADAFSFTTANDQENRDPTTFAFYGMGAGGSWELLVGKDNYPTTKNRKTVVGPFNFDRGRTPGTKPGTKPAVVTRPETKPAVVTRPETKPAVVVEPKGQVFPPSCPFGDCKNPGPAGKGNAPGLSNSASAFLDAHNKVRCLHGVPPMTWNKEIAKKAQQWADSKGPQFQRNQNPHSSNGFRQNVGGHFMLGENIAWQSRPRGYRSPQTKAVYAWYEEIKDTDNGRVRQGNSIPQQPMIGHYTQVVWRDSTDLGCGEYKQQITGAPQEGYGFFVCQYGPAGNMQGSVTDNVNKVNTGASQCADPRAWAAAAAGSSSGQEASKEDSAGSGATPGGQEIQGGYMVKAKQKCLMNPEKGTRLEWLSCDENNPLMRWKKVKGLEGKGMANYMYLVNVKKNTCIVKRNWLQSCGDYTAEGRGWGDECAYIEGSDHSPDKNSGLAIWNPKHRVRLGYKSQEGQKAVMSRNSHEKIDLVN